MRNLVPGRRSTIVRSAFLGVSLGVAVLGIAGLAHASIAGVTAGGVKLASPPADSGNNGVGDDAAQLGFDERQVVVLAAALTVDGGVIPAGTAVNSHMILLNHESAADFTFLSVLNVSWTFNGAVLGVMSDIGGTLEAASSTLLGAPGTLYPGPFNNRGLELAPGSLLRGAGGITNEGYTIVGNTLIVGMQVAQPGDWIRVITAATAEDCKKGGWQSSGQWTNQGDCVSWFATQGKNEPGQNVPNNP